jgi:hypothetical protein
MLLTGLLLIAAVSLAACSTPTGTPSGADEPVSSDDLPTEPPDDQEETSYEYGTASVDSIDVLILESFPVQINVTARGQLPDGCTEIDEAQVQYEESHFAVTLTTRRPTDRMCTEALVPYEYTFPLEVRGLLAGEYTVDVNGAQGSFTLAIDNALPEEQSAGGEMLYDLAPVTGVEARFVAGKPQIIIRGYLPDSCTEISAISDRLEGSTIVVTVETQRPADLMCTQIIMDFETTYTLTSAPGRGTYTIDVNSTAQTQLTIP